MSRHYVGFTERGPVVYKNVRKDVTGEPLVFVDPDEIKTLTLDLSAYLTSGETIANAKASTQSVTAVITNTTTSIDLTLSDATLGLGGRVTVIATLSSGDKWRGVVRVRQTNRYGAEGYLTDYTRGGE